MTELRRRRKELGLCTECGNLAREGKTTCAECAAKHSAADRRRLEERKNGEPIQRHEIQPQYIYTAWRGRTIVKRGTGREVAEFFGMKQKDVWLYATKGIRRRKDGVFIERTPI